MRRLAEPNECASHEVSNEPVIPPRSPPVTRKLTSLFAWWGFKTSFTMSQKLVTDMTMKISDHRLKTNTGIGQEFLSDERSGQEEIGLPCAFISKMNQKMMRLRIKKTATQEK